MPAFGRNGTGKWHLVGPDGCRYGRAFDGETTPDQLTTATDIVAYEPPEDGEASGGSVSVSLSLGGSSFPRGRTDDQRLVLPADIDESESGLCGSCRKTLERQQRRRSRLIHGLKLVTPRRDIDWTVVEHAERRCDWCRARETTTWHSDHLGCTVCPACGRLFGSPLGEPDADSAPDRERLPDTPTEPVEPIVFGTTLPECDPTSLTGSNRPLLKYREKNKYANVVCELERTGHGFSAAGIAALDDIRADYAERVADDDDHQADITLDIGRTPRTVTIEGIYPNHAESVVGSCRSVVRDPDNWFPLGWPRKGYIHHHEMDGAIPGTDPVVEAFPRLETQAPSRSVDTGKLESLTESGRYDRGTRYYERGAVTDIEVVDDRLQATVQGSRPYDVQVTLSQGSFSSGRCSCPDDAVPCKHIVAAVLASGDVETTGPDRPLSDVLADASPDELRTLLEASAEDDIALRKRIYDELTDT